MDPLLTSDEVAAYLRVDVVTIRRLVNQGELPAYRIRGEYRFRRQELEAYLQQQRVPGKDEAPTDTLGALALFVRKLFGGDKSSFNEGMVSSGFERFNGGARSALQCAQDEARRLNHHYIGTEHLLLGLVREGEGTAAQVLKGLGVELAAVRSKVEFIIGHGEHEGEGEVPLTRRAKKVIELAVDEAMRLGHQYLGTEHLLLGMLREGDGIGAQVLRELGVDLRAARAKTMELLNAKQGPEPPSSSAEEQDKDDDI